jgi:hypothetical protein
VACARRLKPEHPRVIAAAERLEAAVTAARAAASKQQSARVARGLPQNSAERARKILFHKHLVPIATDGLELLAGTEGIEAELQLPRLKAPPEEHVRAARRVRAVAEGCERMYIESRDYEPNFLEQFDLAVGDLERAMTAGTGVARADYSTTTLEVKEAVEEVRRRFDSLHARMNEALFDDRALLREWRKCSRIPAKIGRPKKRKGKEKPSDDTGSEDRPTES